MERAASWGYGGSAGALGVTTLNGLTVSSSTGTLSIANGRTLTDTWSGASILLGATGGGFRPMLARRAPTMYLTALSAAGAAHGLVLRSHW